MKILALSYTWPELLSRHPAVRRAREMGHAAFKRWNLLRRMEAPELRDAGEPLNQLMLRAATFQDWAEVVLKCIGLKNLDLDAVFFAPIPEPIWNCKRTASHKCKARYSVA